MYVDDSGSPSMKDNSDFYVISGVIIHASVVAPEADAFPISKKK